MCHGNIRCLLAPQTPILNSEPAVKSAKCKTPFLKSINTLVKTLILFDFTHVSQFLPHLIFLSSPTKCQYRDKKLNSILRRKYDFILTATWEKIYSVLGGVAKRRSPIRNTFSPNAVNIKSYCRLKIEFSFLSRY